MKSFAGGPKGFFQKKPSGYFPNEIVVFHYAAAKA